MNQIMGPLNSWGGRELFWLVLIGTENGVQESNRNANCVSKKCTKTIKWLAYHSGATPTSYAP
jgi:hypothetical protein